MNPSFVSGYVAGTDKAKLPLWGKTAVVDDIALSIELQGVFTLYVPEG
jgi:hypothetical protein